MPKTEIAVFGGGCFWCTEAVFNELKGVISVMPGYAGGTVPNPTYQEVSGGATGHAEVTRVEFDPAHISFTDLLNVFFATHDPTTLNQQGADIGTQYRSAIFYTNEKQKSESLQFIENLHDSFEKHIITEVQPLETFYEAEKYHQKYYENNADQPYCQLVINPKLKKLKEHYKNLLKK